MLFSVPYLLKIASPSYDLFSFLSFALYSLNFLNLLEIKTFKELSNRQKMYTLFTILLLLFAKKNYIFALFSLLSLPMIYEPIIKCYKKLGKIAKSSLVLSVTIFSLLVIYLLNSKFGIVHFFKVFFNSYFNFATMGSNAKRMWMIVPASLPDIINILWILGLIIVIGGEIKKRYSKVTVLLSASTYMINWLGIFAGIYISYKTLSMFDDLSGRYLQPFIIFFIPIIRNFAYHIKMDVSDGTIENIAKYSTIFVMICYLFITFYRGFILRVKPTGVV